MHLVLKFWKHRWRHGWRHGRRPRGRRFQPVQSPLLSVSYYHYYYYYYYCYYNYHAEFFFVWFLSHIFFFSRLITCSSITHMHNRHTCRLTHHILWIFHYSNRLLSVVCLFRLWRHFIRLKYHESLLVFLDYYYYHPLLLFFLLLSFISFFFFPPFWFSDHDFFLSFNLFLSLSLSLSLSDSFCRWEYICFSKKKIR